MELAMSLSTELRESNGQKAAQTNHVRMLNDVNLYPERTKSTPYFFTAGNSVERAPLSHPATDQLMGKSLAEQVMILLVDRCRFLGEFPSRRLLEDRAARITNIYLELKALKYDLPLVTSFGLKHAMVLLESWKMRNLAKNTIYNRWGALRGWVLLLNKNGMLGSIEEHWPEYLQPRKPTVGYRILSDEQIQERSEFLKGQNDKTAYIVERLHREVGMRREQALELPLLAIQAVAHGENIMRVGHGASAYVLSDMAKHQELMVEAQEFMASRSRTKLGWPELSMTDAIAKYSVRLSYVNRSQFGSAPKATAQESAA